MKSYISVSKITVWLLFLFSHATDAATTDLPWKNNLYQEMQNITSVIGVSETNYLVYEGTFADDVLIKQHVSCLVMRMSDFYGYTVAYRKYKIERSTKQETFDLSLWPKMDTGYTVDNYMRVDDEEKQEEIAKMHLVYTDYTICALFYYDNTGDYELWLYKEPDDISTACELLLALLSDKPRNVYYTKDCKQ
uniref:Putative secreted protein n=2 Tax=Ixodes ricinus TaxID=34613 RepID=A0A090X9B8_IXORI